MKKILTGALAALTVGGAIAAALPASAESHDGRGRYEHRDRDGGGALAAGLAGLAVGAALAGGHDGYYDQGYGGGYYEPRGVYDYDGPPPAYYAGPTYYTDYGRCHASWRWDRHWGRYVRVRACY